MQTKNWFWNNIGYPAQHIFQDWASTWPKTRPSGHLKVHWCATLRGNRLSSLSAPKSGLWLIYYYKKVYPYMYVKIWLSFSVILSIHNIDAQSCFGVGSSMIPKKPTQSWYFWPVPALSKTIDLVYNLLSVLYKIN